MDVRLASEGRWNRRRKVIAGLSACAMAGVSLMAIPAGTAAEKGLAPKIYTVTPSSEPGQITGPSSVKVWDAATHTLLKEVPVPASRLGMPDSADGISKPHHFMVLHDRNIGLVMGFNPSSDIKVFDLVEDEFIDGTDDSPDGRSSTIETGTKFDDPDSLPEGVSGLGPRHLEMHPSGDIAYSANFDGDSFSAIDLNTLEEIKTVPVGDRPNYVDYVDTPAGPRLFVANFGENYVSVFDANTYEPVRTEAAPEGKVTVGEEGLGGPFNMAVSHDQRYVMPSNARSNTVNFIDSTTLEVTSTVDIGGDHRTDLPASAFQRLNPRISPEGKWLWIGNQDASETTIIDIEKQEKVGAIPSGLGADLIFFPRGPGEGYAFITNRYDKKVTVAKLNGNEPPTYVGQIPTARIGSHYMTFDKKWETAIVSERPGRAYAVFNMKIFKQLGSMRGPAVQRALNRVETASIWTGGFGDEWEPDYSDDYVRAGADMAVYVWFENGIAQVSEERGGD